ncbi:MAG: hypothetical protein ABIQ39_04175 [Ilumatobacteraceae bacterium]
MKFGVGMLAAGFVATLATFPFIWGDPGPDHQLDAAPSWTNVTLTLGFVAFGVAIVSLLAYRWANPQLRKRRAAERLG